MADNVLFGQLPYEEDIQASQPLTFANYDDEATELMGYPEFYDQPYEDQARQLRDIYLGAEGQERSWEEDEEVQKEHKQRAANLRKANGILVKPEDYWEYLPQMPDVSMYEDLDQAHAALDDWGEQAKASAADTLGIAWTEIEDVAEKQIDQRIDNTKRYMTAKDFFGGEEELKGEAPRAKYKEDLAEFAVAIKAMGSQLAGVVPDALGGEELQRGIETSTWLPDTPYVIDPENNPDHEYDTPLGKFKQSELLAGIGSVAASMLPAIGVSRVAGVVGLGTQAASDAGSIVGMSMGGRMAYKESYDSVYEKTQDEDAAATAAWLNVPVGMMDGAFDSVIALGQIPSWFKTVGDKTFKAKVLAKLTNDGLLGSTIKTGFSSVGEGLQEVAQEYTAGQIESAITDDPSFERTSRELGLAFTTGVMGGAVVGGARATMPNPNDVLIERTNIMRGVEAITEKGRKAVEGEAAKGEPGQQPEGEVPTEPTPEAPIEPEGGEEAPAIKTGEDLEPEVGPIEVEPEPEVIATPEEIAAAEDALKTDIEKPEVAPKIFTDVSNRQPAQKGVSELEEIAPALGRSKTEVAENYTRMLVPLQQLIINHPKLIQFKTNANEKGIVNELRGKFRTLGTPPIIVFVSKEGEWVVATGRHRTDLAIRSGNKNIVADVIREEDGYTWADAQILDAESNIQDGKGKVQDFANYFKLRSETEEGITYAEAEERGLFNDDKGTFGFNIGTKAARNLYETFQSEANLKEDIITARQASKIAEIAPHDEVLQQRGMELVRERKKLDIIEGILRLTTATKTPKGATPQAGQGVLFGDNVFNDATKLAESAEELRKEARSRERMLQQIASLSKEQQQEALRDIGVKLDVNDPQAIKATRKKLKDRIRDLAPDNYPSNPTMLQEILERANSKLPEGQKITLRGFGLAGEAQPARTLPQRTPEEMKARITELSTKAQGEILSPEEEQELKELTVIYEDNIPIKQEDESPKELNLIIGKKAKGVQKSLLPLAKRLPSKEAFETTGWFKGPDGKWRFEIDDSKAKIPQLKSGTIYPINKKTGKELKTLGQLLDHPVLFHMYPELKDVRVLAVKLPDGTRATMGEVYGIPEIELNKENIDFSSEGTAQENRDNLDQIKKTLLHEIQHAIQSKESFAKGGNLATSEMFEGEMRAALKKITKEMPNVAQGSPQLVRMLAQGSIYQRLFGEKEARLVSERADLTPRERRENYPFEFLTTNPERFLFISQEGDLIENQEVGIKKGVLPKTKAKALAKEFSEPIKLQRKPANHIKAQLDEARQALDDLINKPKEGGRTSAFTVEEGEEFQRLVAEKQRLEELWEKVRPPFDPQTEIVKPIPKSWAGRLARLSELRRLEGERGLSPVEQEQFEELQDWEDEGLEQIEEDRRAQEWEEQQGRRSGVKQEPKVSPFTGSEVIDVKAETKTSIKKLSESKRLRQKVEEDGPVSELSERRRPITPEQNRQLSEDELPKNAIPSPVDMADIPKQYQRVEPAPLVSPDSKVKPTKDIIFDAVKALGSILQFKGQSRRASGTYVPGTGKTAINYQGNLSTTAHELAHFIDDSFQIMKDIHKKTSSKLQRSVDAELLKNFDLTTPSDASLALARMEGFAEYLRAWAINPDEAQRLAPNFTKYMKKTLPKSVLAEVRKFGDDIRRFAGVDEAEKIKANMRWEPLGTFDRMKSALVGRKANGFEVTAYDKIATKWLDSLRLFEQAVDFAKEQRGQISKLLPSVDPMLMARLFSGINAKIEYVLEKGQVDVNGNSRGDGGFYKLFPKGFDDTSIDTITEDAKYVAALAIAQRTVSKAQQFFDEAFNKIMDQVTEDATPEEQAKAHERAIKAGVAQLERQNIAGIGGGFEADYAVAKRLLKNFENHPKRKVYEEALRRYRKWADNNLRYLVEAGRLSEEAYQEIKANNQYYVAMQRIREIEPGVDLEEVGINSRTGKIGVPHQPIKRFKGSASDIENPYTALIRSTANIMREADRNRIMSTFVDMLKDHRSMYQGKPSQIASVGREADSNQPNTIPVWQNGVKTYWRFDPDLYKALKGLEGVTPLSGWLTILPKILRAGVVYSPPFLIRNVIRDLTQRLVVSRSGVKESLLETFNRRGDLDYDDLRRDGGDQAGHYLSDAVNFNRALKAAMQSKELTKNSIFISPKGMLEGYKNLTRASELANRIPELNAAYKQSKKNNPEWSELDHRMYAAGQARELMDFAVAGTWMRVINQLIPFSNPAIQGMRRSIRSANEDPAGFMARWAMFVVLPTIAERMINYAAGDDEERDQLPDYIQDLFWNFKIAPNVWVRIPKPHELGILASGVGRAFDAAMGKENAFDGYAGTLARNVLPVDEGDLAGPLAGIAQALGNVDFFRGRRPIPFYEENLALEYRNTEKASRIGNLVQTLSKEVGLGSTGFGKRLTDARMVDFLIREQFGVLGSLATKASNIGHKDKPRTLGVSDLIGLSTGAPAYASKDVQFVFNFAENIGMGARSKHLKKLKQLLQESYQAETNKEKDSKARQVRAEAARLRKKFEDAEEKLDMHQLRKKFTSRKK